jgi:hypothetical protein
LAAHKNINKRALIYIMFTVKAFYWYQVGKKVSDVCCGALTIHLQSFCLQTLYLRCVTQVWMYYGMIDCRLNYCILEVCRRKVILPAVLGHFINLPFLLTIPYKACTWATLKLQITRRQCFNRNFSYLLSPDSPQITVASNIDIM